MSPPSVIHQPIDFDFPRTRALLEHLDHNAPQLAGMIEAVALGDYSCTYRNQLMLGRIEHDTAFSTFRQEMHDRGVRLFFQLPLVTKQSELANVEELITKWWDFFDGFITGDLGVLSLLDTKVRDGNAKSRGKTLIFTSNVLNHAFSRYLEDHFRIHRIRPLMHKRTFIEEDSGFEKDVVLFGNMMINSSIFCFHCGGPPTRCDFSCAEPKKLVMEHELVHMVGRALVTENRLDLLDRLDHIPRLRSITIMDLDLSPEEIGHILQQVSDKTAERTEPVS